jgi:hypothetical protein
MPYDPEHLLSFRSIERHTIPLLHRSNGRLGMGSGVLVDIRDRRFVATAFHCVDHAVVLTEDVLIPHDNTSPPARIPILNCGGDPDIDIGFLEIDRRSVVRTAHEHYPCTLDQFYIGTGIPPESIIHICGWPEYGGRRIGPNVIERTLEGLIAKCLGADTTFLRFQFSGAAGKWNDRDEWIVKPTPSPRGFSGGGCWGITKAKDGDLYAPTKTTKLLAIQSEWDCVAICKAPLISEWVRVIGQQYPELRDFMLSELSKN